MGQERKLQAEYLGHHQERKQYADGGVFGLQPGCRPRPGNVRFTQLRSAGSGVGVVFQQSVDVVWLEYL